ncbi:MAG: rod shape-determining protein MreC [Candidatus Hydrothermia bacterium]
MKRKLLYLFLLLTVFFNIKSVNIKTSEILLKSVYSPFIYARNLIILLKETEKINAVLLKENLKLREILAYSDHHIFNTSPDTIFSLGEILSYSPLGVPQEISLRISKLAPSKFENSTLVDFKGNLVGKVSYLFNDLANALLIYSPAFRAAVECHKPYYTGLLVGGNKPQVIYVPFDAGAELGDTLYTSSLSTVLAPGIPVGIVSKVVKDSTNPIFIKLYVTPFFKPFTSRKVILYGK